MQRWMIVPALVGLAAASPLEIRFGAPAKAWDSEALPIGNGRLGAMLFGEPARERVQFNVDSLWTGGENESGGYDLNEFGAYQNFGDLFLETGGGGGAAAPACASGHEPFHAGEGVAAAGDGDTGTKWCVEHQDREVVWQVGLGEPRALARYSFTSADDVPGRDPHAWRFEGSNDCTAWTTLDERRDQSPFAKRHEQKSFECANGTAFRHYRFVFAPGAGVAHFQLAELALDGLPGTPDAADYSRVLDLATGIHTARWRRDGVTYTRETFASHPHQVIVMRLTADQPVKLSGRLRLAGTHGEQTRAGEAALAFAGVLPNGLRYAAGVAAGHRGGSVTAEGDALVFGGCHELVVLLGAATDYALGEAGGWRSGKDPAAEVQARLDEAAGLPWERLREAHVADHQSLMGRVSLDLGPAPAGTTPERLAAVKDGGTDPALEALQFQFGRYLLIACSRPGTLPANLQGLWNDSNKPAWFADYHTNINIQMNYWLAEPANLADCHTPLLDWVEACIPAARRATLKQWPQAGDPGSLRSRGDDHERDARATVGQGWTMRTSVNAFGGNGWQWNLPASAWLSRHFWEHYAFSGDRDFLTKRAWPVLRDVSLFWLGHLKEADGKLVVPGGWSPEHGPREDGVAHDQQLVWELFTHTLAAAAAAGDAAQADSALLAKVRDARARLLGPQVGSWGQLMEWTTERPQLEKSGHRHTSHLYAVYPGHQISLARTPELARAAAVSLEARGTSGDSRRSWTWPWRTALWARLGEADKAHEMVRSLLAFNTMPNLFTTHPPFQIDGNLGITGGVCEMLVQSHAGEVAILPALPAAWPGGSFSGLRARGGITVDAAWAGGRVTRATVRADRDTTATVRLPGAAPREVRLTAGKPLELAGG